MSDPGSSDAGRESTPADDDLLSVRLGRLHVAAGAAGRSAAAASGCPCGRRCRSLGALGCRRRRLVLRPARLKPVRRPLLREPRLLRPIATAASAAAAGTGAVWRRFGAGSGTVFGGAAPDRCSEFGQLSTATLSAAGASGSSPFADTGAPVFAASATAAAAPTEPQSGSPPTTTCSVQPPAAAAGQCRRAGRPGGPGQHHVQHGRDDVYVTRPTVRSVP